MDNDARQKVEKATKDLLDNQETIEAQQTVISEILKAKHNALLAAGFSADQALAIITARGIEP